MKTKQYKEIITLIFSRHAFWVEAFVKSTLWCCRSNVRCTSSTVLWMCLGNEDHWVWQSRLQDQKWSVSYLTNYCYHSYRLSYLYFFKKKRLGETFDVSKHPQVSSFLWTVAACSSWLCIVLLQEAEVKAVTYCNMQIFDEPGRHEAYVIVDIWQRLPRHPKFLAYSI